MSTLRDDTATKVSAEVAEVHVQKYYQALESSRSVIPSFFVPQSSMLDGNTLPAIVINGNVISTAEALRDLFVKEMPPTKYDIQCFDSHVINPNYTVGGASKTDGSNGRNMSVLVVVSGTVRLGTGKDNEKRGFSDSFVLVPNPEMSTAKARRKPLREWLVQSKTSRLVV